MDVGWWVGLVTGVLGIPSSMFAVYQIRKTFFPDLDDPSTVMSKTVAVLSRHAIDESRDLLTFSKEKVNMAGTLENQIAQFVARVPETVRANLTVNPLGLAQNQFSVSKGMGIAGALSAIGTVVMIGSIFLVAEEWPSRLALLGGSLFSAFYAIGAGAMSYDAYQTGSTAKDYAGFLRSNGIVVGIEYTRRRDTALAPA